MPTIIYPDEYIEHWGEVFAERDLFNQRGILFDTFLMSPQEILAAVEQSPRMEPLLPSQAAAMHRDIEEALIPDGAQLRERGYVQPMRHHAYGVSSDRHKDRRVAV